MRYTPESIGAASCGMNGPEVRQVAAHRRPGGDAQREEASVLVGRELGDRIVVAPLRVREEAFAALGGPAHRALEPPRRPHHGRLLGIQEDLHAERAADVARHHAQLLARRFDDRVGDLAVKMVRALARRIERGAPACRVVLGERGARLDRVRDQAVVDQLEPGDVRRLRERRIHLGLALAQADFERHFAFPAPRSLPAAARNRPPPSRPRPWPAASVSAITIATGSPTCFTRLEREDRPRRLLQARHRDQAGDVAQAVGRSRPCP